MKCMCGYKNDADKWNYIEFHSHQGGPTGAIGRVADQKLGLGRISIYVCPDCGLFYSDMAGKTKKNKKFLWEEKLDEEYGVGN